MLICSKFDRVSKIILIMHALYEPASTCNAQVGIRIMQAIFTSLVFVYYYMPKRESENDHLLSESYQEKLTTGHNFSTMSRRKVVCGTCDGYKINRYLNKLMAITLPAGEFSCNYPIGST